MANEGKASSSMIGSYELRAVKKAFIVPHTCLPRHWTSILGPARTSYFVASRDNQSESILTREPM